MTARLLTPDDRAVIRERHFGWERAEPGLLAAVFGVSVQKISAILRTPGTATCTECHRPLSPALAGTCQVATCPHAQRGVA